MVNENHPKFRRLRKQIARRDSKRAPYDRILIVTEDMKSSRFYFEEIRKSENLSSVNVRVLHSQIGTDPLSVVSYAKQIFNEGDLSKQLEPRSFDRIFAVFDRDDHATYNAAFECANSYNKRFKNDNKVRVPFEVIVSIPCFELWLLLHFQNVSHRINSIDCVRQLLVHFPDYNKAATDIFVKTKDKINVAQGHSERLARTNSAMTAPEPYTDIGKLVSVLMNLKSPTK